MVRVACCSASTAGLALARMTSGASAANSAAGPAIALALAGKREFGKPEIGPVAPFYLTMSCSLMTDRLSVHGDPLRRKHSHAPVRAVRKCLYVEIRGKVVGRTHHRRWG